MSDEEIVWTCSVCGKPVGDGDGYLAVAMDEVNKAERERQEWEEANPTASTLSGLRTYPTAHWQVFHTACDPAPARGPSRIDVKRMRSPWDALAWTAYLMGENWISATDWHAVIEELAAAHGGDEASKPA